MSLRCEIAQQCVGAFLVYTVNGLQMNDRLAGSDISVPPDRTESVEIGATSLGNHLASAHGGTQGSVIMVLQGSGYQATQPSLLLHG